MKKASLVFSLFIILVLIVLYGWVGLAVREERSAIKQAPAQAETAPDDNLPKIDLQPTFYKPEKFRESLIFAEDVPVKKNIRAIIVPHDLTASRYTAALIKQASGRRIGTVVIIGPNHDNIGVEPVATVTAAWQAPDGYVQVNEALVKNFLADFNLYSNTEVFEREHAIGAIIPYLSYYLPEAELLPVVFNSYAGLKEASRAAKWLSENLPVDSLVIYSIDFSHYLTKAEAEIKDEITQELIENSAIDKILQLDNDNLDSPASLATALLLAQIEQYELDINYHSNSGDLAASQSAETTSHFGIVFLDRKEELK